MTTIPNVFGRLVGEMLGRLHGMQERPREPELEVDEDSDDEVDLEVLTPPKVLVEDWRERAALVRYPVEQGKPWSNEIKRTYKPDADLHQRSVGICLHANGVTRKESSSRMHMGTCQVQITNLRALWLHPWATRLLASNWGDVAPLHAINVEVLSKGGSSPITPEQVVALDAAIDFIVADLAADDIEVEWIAPHRVFATADYRSRAARYACPGREIWRVGERAARRHGLAVPPEKPLRTGLAVIPKDWHGPDWHGGEGLARMNRHGA